MNHIKFKKFIINITSILFAVFLWVFIANIIFIKVSHQKLFPRSLAGSLSNILLTFHPDTYNINSLKNYTAVIGSSYALGGGDAYLSGIYNYSITHHLHSKDGKNYLNFARAGYGSISAISNLIKMHKISNFPNFIRDLEKPQSIIFFINEGYVLEANYNEYKLFKKENNKINDFVINRINENLKLSKDEKLMNNFPLLYFVTVIYEDIKILFKEIIKDPKKIKTLVMERLKKLFGYTIILKTNDNDKKDLNKYTNSIKNQKTIRNIAPLQGAAPTLKTDEMSISLEIFFQTVKYIKNWAQTDEILILYIPSPISSYEWNEPIYYEVSESLQSGITTNKKNNLKSTFIRDKINNFSKLNNIVFLDPTDYIVKNAKNKILHGPLDWSHFNYEGYKIVSNYIIDNIKK